MKKLFFFGLITFLAITLLSASCDRRAKRPPKTYTQDELIELNRQKVGLETDLIDAFVEKSGWAMIKTPTGLRYDIYGASPGEVGRKGMVATITFKAYLLDSTVVESTDISAPRQFRIGESDVVSGLHEVMTLLSKGDSARVIIPSYLAYGLTGDEKIPSNAALLYDLQVLDIH